MAVVYISASLLSWPSLKRWYYSACVHMVELVAWCEAVVALTLSRFSAIIRFGYGLLVHHCCCSMRADL
jgi:hypothetical protein